jgi:hypothetical protein
MITIETNTVYQTKEIDVLNGIKGKGRKRKDEKENESKNECQEINDLGWFDVGDDPWFYCLSGKTGRAANR